MPTNDAFAFEIDGVSSDLRVASYRGSEELNALFQYEVVLQSEERELSLGKLLGQHAVLSVRGSAQETPRYVHGIISDAEQGAEGKTFATYRVTLVPEVWKLDGKIDMRIFQAMSAPEIIDAVIQGAGLQCSKARPALRGSYGKREYCVQYRESDWDFIVRLMEEEGMYCFFEHTEAGHTLVIGDGPDAHEKLPGGSTLAFRPPHGALVAGEGVSEFRYREAMQPGKVTLRDYNFKKPQLDLTSADGGGPEGHMEVYDYPGSYEEPGEGQGLAKVRLERWQAQRKTGWGASSCPRIAPGYVMTLGDHPNGDLNRDWLVTRAEQTGSQATMSGEGAGGAADGHQTRFWVMPSDVPYRPAPRTPKPRIHGAQTAIVVGPAGEEIYPDEHGRVKVHFHWDRLGKRDEKSSCWIRVSQAWAGGAWGAMQIPRIGHEVVVEFLEGDPDRPLIVGRVYHATNVPPYPLPAEKTKSTIKSNSSPGGGGFNELRFEDQKSKEEVYLHAQKDWNIVVEHDETKRVGNDERHDVGNDRTKKVIHDESETIGNDKTINVGGQHAENIGGNQLVTVAGNAAYTVAGAFAESIGQAKALTVGGALAETVGATKMVTVAGDVTERIGGARQEDVGKNETVTIAGDRQLTIGKGQKASIGESDQLSVHKEQTITVGEAYSLTVGDGKLTIKKDGSIVLEGKDIKIQGSGNIHVKGAKLVVDSDGSVEVNASGSIKLKGSTVGVN